jgi:hypothetical protein
MKKLFMNRLTMLAVTLMASMAAFAQGKFDAGVTTTLDPHSQGEYFDLNELRYYVTKVTSGVQELEVVGFASYVCSSTGDPNLMTTKYNGKVTIPNYIQGSGTAAWVCSVAENAFTTTVRSGDDKPNRDQFTAAAALVTKLAFLYDEVHAYHAADIKAKAFSGLTKLTDVNNDTPETEVADIASNAFANTTYDKAELVVPEDAIFTYSGAAGWTNFMKMSDKDGNIRGDVDGDYLVDDFDYVLIIDAFLNDEYSKEYDIDGDGFADDFDATLIVEIFGLRD